MDPKTFLKTIQQNRWSQKGQNGRVLVIGGSALYAGAPALAGLAAMRSGVDLVTIAAPEKVAWAMNALSPDLITVKLPGQDFQKRHWASIQKLVAKNDVVLIGNGLSRKSFNLIKLFIHKIGKPMVLDAGALRIIRFQDVSNCLLTPHRDELRSLLRNSGYRELVPELNRKVISKSFLKTLQKVIGQNVLLFKSPIADYIISKNKIAENQTGNAGMTRGGTGDTLAGLCAGFLAQTGKLFESAETAAYLNGLSGDRLLNKKKGYSFLASDIVEEIGRIMNKRG